MIIGVQESGSSAFELIVYRPAEGNLPNAEITDVHPRAQLLKNSY